MSKYTPSDKNAYDKIVGILKGYHQDKVPDTIDGYEVINGKMVLARESVCKGDCPIAVMRIPSHPAYPLHQHSFTEISVVIRGFGNNTVDGHTFHIKAGDVFILHGSHEHSIEEPDSLEILNICFDSELLGFNAREFPDSPAYRTLFEVDPGSQQFSSFNNFLHLAPERLSRLLSLASEIDVEIQQAEIGHISIARGYLVTLIGLLSRWFVSSDPTTSTDTRRVAKAIIWMEQNLENSPSSEQLGKMCGLSRRQFFRVFKQCTGQTPADYLQHIRLRRGQRLLRDPNLTVTEVAFASGFNDSNHFSRSFKKAYGMTPSIYRAGHLVSGGYKPSATKPPSVATPKTGS